MSWALLKFASLIPSKWGWLSATTCSISCILFPRWALPAFQWAILIPLFCLLPFVALAKLFFSLLESQKAAVIWYLLCQGGGSDLEAGRQRGEQYDQGGGEADNQRPWEKIDFQSTWKGCWEAAEGEDHGVDQQGDGVEGTAGVTEADQGAWLGGGAYIEGEQGGQAEGDQVGQLHDGKHGGEAGGGVCLVVKDKQDIVADAELGGGHGDRFCKNTQCGTVKNSSGFVDIVDSVNIPFVLILTALWIQIVRMINIPKRIGIKANFLVLVIVVDFLEEQHDLYCFKGFEKLQEWQPMAIRHCEIDTPIV